MMRYVSLFIALLLFWLALSGQSKPFLVGGGIVSALACVFVAWRMGATDREAHPNHLFIPALTYFPWLIWEIFKSAWAVTRIVLDPKLPISPTLTKVAATQRSAVGLVTYANSITLTPGTMTIEIEDNILTVHALVRDGAVDVEGGGMDQRVTQFEGAT